MVWTHKKTLIFAFAIFLTGLGHLYIRHATTDTHKVTHDTDRSRVKYPARINSSNHTTDCDVHTLLRLTSSIEDIQRYASCQRVFYNRVPKCGSRGVLSVFTRLAKQNNFSLLSLSKSLRYGLKEKDRENLTRLFEDVREPFLVSKHVYYIDFERYGLLNPVYINVMRDPIDRAISHFYYKLYGSEKLKKTPPDDTNETLSFDDCLVKSGPSCQYVQNVVLPFFCGHGSVCKGASDEEIVARAKTTIRERYLVVGLTEDLPGFMEVLETLMPRFFANASKIYRQTEETLVEKYRTNKRAGISENTRQLLRHTMAPEYELYNFVKQRFYHQLRKVRLLKSRNKVVDMLMSYDSDS